MSLVIYGKTICPICGRVIKADQNIIQLPPFISNELDSLHKYNDGVFHDECFHDIKESDKLLTYVEDYNELTNKMKSYILNGALNDPDNILSIGILSSDPQDKLSRFNFKIYLRTNFSRQELLELKQDLLLGKKEDRIKGKSLDWILSKIDDFIS